MSNRAPIPGSEQDRKRWREDKARVRAVERAERLKTIREKGLPRSIRVDSRIAAWEEAIRLKIRGATDIQVADILGVRVKTLQRWKQQPEFTLRMMRTKKAIFDGTMNITNEKAMAAVENVEKLIEEYSTKAIHRIAEKMEKAENEGLQLKAAIDLADRGTRTSKTKKVASTHLHAFLTPELLREAARVAKDMLEDDAIGYHVEPVALEPIMADDINKEPVLEEDPNLDA